MSESDFITSDAPISINAKGSVAQRKPVPRPVPKWEMEARERLKVAIRRFARPLSDLVARDANEGDTRLLVTDFLCEGFGFDRYTDLTTEYQVKGEFADYGVRIERELIAFIEVKRVATKLASKHLRQVEMYAVNEGVELKRATSPQSLAEVLVSGAVVEEVRKELRRKTGHNVDPAELVRLLQETVLKPDCLA